MNILKKQLQHSLEGLISFTEVLHPHRCFQLLWQIRHLDLRWSSVDLLRESLYLIKLYEPVGMMSE